MERRVTTVDWIMLALAIVSVGMLIFETWGPVTPEQSQQILRADLVIIAIFALEFSIRWAKDDKPKTFLWRNWYELLGMIPVAHPAIRGFRLFRILRIVVILSRFGRAADRAFGEQVTAKFLTKFKAVILEIIGDAITVRVLDMTLDVMQKGEYTKNLANHLEANSDEMLQIIVEKVKEDPNIGRVRHVPFFDDLVATSSRVTTRLIIDLLRDDRMDAMVKAAITQNVNQMRAAVAAKESLGRSATPPSRG